MRQPHPMVARLPPAGRLVLALASAALAAAGPQQTPATTGAGLQQQLAPRRAQPKGSSLVGLYDEIALIKARGANALLRLDYFAAKPEVGAPGHSAPSSANTTRPGDGGGGAGDDGRPSTRRKPAIEPHAGAYTPEPTSGGPIMYTSLTWMQRLKLGLEALLMAPPGPHSVRVQQVGAAAPVATQPMAPVLPFRPARQRRQASAELLERPEVGEQPACTQLEPAKLARCRVSELSLSSALNYSFPGTPTAIDETCAHATYLLGTCWPRQLEALLAGSQTGRDKVHLALASQPAGSRPEQAASCNVDPRVAPAVLERINWLWLNLCTDTRFRDDYVRNLKCLSLWTQEHAQAVCTDDYRRMQANMLSSGAVGDLQQQQQQQQLLHHHQQQQAPVQQRRRAAEPAFQPRPQSYSGLAMAGSSPQHASAAPSELADTSDAELESKTLCCMFDLFLRCVNNQATRDCGRAGGQFVVNFMSRIGTEDMKYLCNGEPKIARHRPRPGPQGASPPLAPSDRGPFIESSYCAEPRIQVAIYGLRQRPSPTTTLARPSAGHHTSRTSHSAARGGALGQRANLSSEPNRQPSMYERDQTPPYHGYSNHCAPRLPLLQLVALAGLAIMIFGTFHY